MKTVLFMVLMIIGFFYLVYKGTEKSDSQVVACRDKGGYALMERGVFQDCLKGVEVIE